MPLALRFAIVGGVAVSLGALIPFLGALALSKQYAQSARPVGSLWWITSAAFALVFLLSIGPVWRAIRVHKHLEPSLGYAILAMVAAAVVMCLPSAGMVLASAYVNGVAQTADLEAHEGGSQ